MNIIERTINGNGGKLELKIRDLLEENSIYSVLNSKGFVEYASKGFCTLFDVPVTDILGKLSPLFINNRNKGLVKNLSTKSLENGYKWKGTLKVDGKKSRKMWIKTTIMPLERNYDSTFIFLTIHEDVTKLKLELSDFKNSSSMHEYIYDSVKVGIVIVLDSKGIVIKWNKGAQRSFGYTSSEILGEPVSRLMGGKFSNAEFSNFLQHIEIERNLQNEEILELYCTDKQGKEFPTEFVISKWRMKGADYYGIKMLDISKRMAIQNRLHKKTKELELMLYRSAHELNAPFSSAQGLIDLMKIEENSPKVKELIEMLQRTIDQAKVLSSGLHKSSLILDNMSYRKTIDFKKIITDVLKILKDQKVYKDFVFNIAIDDSVTFVSNPNLIFTLFNKLLDNAVKYTYQASSSKLPIIDLTIEKREGEVKITVCDNGKGIRKRDINRIFEIYYRAKVENTGRSNGLGLYIVSKIVDSLNGKIAVESKFNQGSCFIVTLPHIK
ncbi:PAS domain-containing sensor histidine kinase [uncultured Maribacter sp.]|uniref:PAS domain-containing sensor histidine kinase n=1 Tax=uncultured Maribacter sp. TaxID=431308 RepID=UPI0030DCDC8F|tara:strand:+ start:1846 stop:3333 length:1488 start_codon:yes stop_codon:yes gene_type:complete